MKKFDELISEDRRVHSMFDYMTALNTFVGYNQDDAEKAEDVKLAKVLIFDIEFYSKIRDVERFEYISDVLDYYTKIVPNENDLFKRPIIEFHVPENIRKSLFKSFVEFDKNRKLELKEDTEKLMSSMPTDQQRLKAILLEQYGKQIDEYFRQNRGESTHNDGNEMDIREM